MPKAGNHFIMSVLDAMGCERAEDIFNFGEGGNGAISGMIFQNYVSLCRINYALVQSVRS